MKKNLNSPIRLAHLRDPVIFLACGFGTGLTPKAPGTVGTLPGVVLVWWLWQVPVAWRIGVVVALCVAGVWLCHVAAQRLGVHDHPGIVWDEIAGFTLALLFVPVHVLTAPMAQEQFLLVGFIAFRVFDIWKPWPIRLADQRLSGGLGIMLDDVLAAGYAGLILWLLGHYAILPMGWA